MKKRILFFGESTYLDTGFSTYYREIMTRLHKMGRFELGEIGAYGSLNDPRARAIPWTFFPVLPANDEEAKVYNSQTSNQFGGWRLEEACVNFCPSVLASARDPWMDSAVANSPLRPYYRWVFMPTCDSAPQSEEWIDLFLRADAVLTYSEYGKRVLDREGGGLIRTVGTASPAADYEIFKPVFNKSRHKQEMGLPGNSLIVGTIARNQRRKLYADLVNAFALYMKAAPSEQGRRSYLYLHTSYPDLGWDIPRLVKEAGLGAKTILTYVCREQSCGHVFPALYQDARAHCPRCGRNNASLPGSQQGVSRQALSGIINLFDVYTQYSVCEGFGMGIVEAAACGVQTFVVNYSAMEDFVQHIGARPIRVQRMFRESETHLWRALPDDADLANQLVDFLSLPEGMRIAEGMRSRHLAMKRYSYDQAAQAWADQFDRLEVSGWSGPPQLHHPRGADTQGNVPIPEGLTDEEFARWGLTEVAGRPDLAHSHVALRVARDLNWGVSAATGGLNFDESSFLGSQHHFRSYTRGDAMREFLTLCNTRNHWEMRRAEVCV